MFVVFSSFFYLSTNTILRTDQSGEYTITWRAPFPGAPFRDNEFNFDSYDGNGDPEPVIVCTPSVNNLGSQKRMSLIVICMTALIISVFIL